MVIGLCLPGRGHCSWWFKWEAWMENIDPPLPSKTSSHTPKICHTVPGYRLSWQINICLGWLWMAWHCCLRPIRELLFIQVNEQMADLPTGVFDYASVPKRPLNASCPILKDFYSLFFIRLGIIWNQYTAASYEMRACSTDVSCLTLLSDSIAPH